jgi:hypothetical protein
LATLETGVRLLEEELLARQRDAGAPEGTFITADVLSKSDAAVELQGSRLRVMAAVGVIGLAIAATVAFALEALRGGGRRPSRRLDAVSYWPPRPEPARTPALRRETADPSPFPRDALPIDTGELSRVVATIGPSRRPNSGSG